MYLSVFHIVLNTVICFLFWFLEVKTNMGNVEQEVDRIIEDNDLVLNAVEIGDNYTPRHMMKKTKKMFKRGSMLLVLVVAAMIASGALLTLFSAYTGSQEGSVDLDGITAMILFDNVPMTTETFDVDMDITTIAAGESFIGVHTAEALEDNGDWDITFDASAVTGFPVEDPFFGFYYDILSTVSQESVLDTTTIIRSWDPAFSFDFTYALDEMYAAQELPLPYVVGINLVDHVVLPPIAPDLEVVVPFGGIVEYPLLDFCDPPFNQYLDIVYLTNDISQLTLQIQGEYPDEFLYLDCSYPKPCGIYPLTYIIENEDLESATGTLTLIIE